jgi:hypothetical protein
MWLMEVHHLENGRLLSRYDDTVKDLDFAGRADCFAEGGVFDGHIEAFCVRTISRSSKISRLAYE